MKTIVVSSQKGGSAKTTLTAHLSVEAERVGDGPVWLVDTDRQGTLTRWHERRTADTPALGAVAFRRLAAGVSSLGVTHNASFCFIDTAPAISDQSTSVIELADLVLIPVQPSPADLWAVSETVELVRKAGKKFLFIMCKVKPQATITSQTIAALSHHGPVAQAFIVDRVAYATALAGGNSAPELNPKGKGATNIEIEALWTEVKSCVQQNMKTSRRVKNG